ncbi:MAG TPA: hypothetical protein VHO69_01885 [Phototrophicaceae bacterium]|nr:hypothetical protein [Phototrophicaceae bacterium]
MTHLILQLYASLLRLYPPEFRAEFAEEMGDVFALALTEAEPAGVLTLMAICLTELRDLPLSLIREHLRERRQKQLNLEGIMVIAETPIRIYRFCAYSLLLIAAAYGLLVVLPIFCLRPALAAREPDYRGAF